MAQLICFLVLTLVVLTGAFNDTGPPSRDLAANSLAELALTTAFPGQVVTTDRPCPPSSRWDSPTSHSFVECLCEKDSSDQQPCVLGFTGLLGRYERLVVPDILPRISASDLGHLYLWTTLGFQCHPFMGIGGLSIACYREKGSFPMSKDCRFSQSRFFCEVLICVDISLGTPGMQPQDFLNCIRRSSVSASTPGVVSPTTAPNYPPYTSTQSDSHVASLLDHDDHPSLDNHDNHDGHDHHMDEEHLRMDTIKVVSGVVGGILGGILVTAVIFIICWLHRRQRHNDQPSTVQPKPSVKREESSVYAEVDDASSPRYHSPPDVINNTQSPENNQYSSISDEYFYLKRPAGSSIYNKLRDDGAQTASCDHVYNRAQFVNVDTHGTGLEQKVRNCDSLQKPIMKKHPSTGCSKKRVYFTLEPTQNESSEY